MIELWQLAFRLQTPLAVGKYVDISLPRFETRARAQDSAAASLSSTQATTTTFAFEVMAKSVDPDFPPTLPDQGPEFVNIGCYEDVSQNRAVGGGTCGNFNDGDGVVTTVCVYTCVCVYIYIHACSYIYYICIYVYMYINVCVYVCVCLCQGVRVCVCCALMHVCMHVRMRAC